MTSVTCSQNRLWADPDKETEAWGENDRGVSFTFGPKIVQQFLQFNQFDLIARAHQVVEDGYEFFAKRQLVSRRPCKPEPDHSR